MSGWFAPAGDLVAILSLESLSLSTRPILPDGPSLKVEMDWLGMWVSASSLQKCSMALLRGYDDSNSKIISRHKYKDNDKDDDRDKVPETANICWSPWPPWSPLSPWSPGHQGCCCWTGLLHMIIWRGRPLANDHPEGPASCKWSSAIPVTLVTSARIQIQSRVPF